MADTTRETPVVSGQQSWLGGVDNYLQADLLGPTQSVELLNGEVFQRSTLRRRLGLQSLKVIDTALTSSFRPVFLRAYTHPVIGPVLVSLVNRDAGTGRFVILDGSNSALSFTASHHFSDEAEVTLFADRFYILDPGYIPEYWEPGATQLRPDPGSATAMPQGSTGVYFRKRGYVAGVPGHPKALFFSLILGNVNADADLERTGQLSSKIFDWHEQQSFLFEHNIVALVPYHNLAIVVFGDRGIEIFEPDNCAILESTIQVASRHIGCGSKHTVVHCGEELLFMDQEGHVRSLKQSLTDEAMGVTAEPLSKPITDTVRRVNGIALRAARAAFVGGIYWIAWPMDGSLVANEMWGFSIKDRAWIGPYRFREDIAASVTAPFGVSGLASQRFPQDFERFYLLTRDASDQATIFKALQGATDSGTLIPFRVVTRAYDMDRPGEEKEWQHLEVWWRFLNSNADASVTITVRARVDEGEWKSMPSITATPDAGPTINEGAGTPVINESAGTPVLVGYSVQHLTSMLTGLGRGNTVQFELTVRESASRFEILKIATSAMVNNLRFTRSV